MKKKETLENYDNQKKNKKRYAKKSQKISILRQLKSDERQECQDFIFSDWLENH